MARAENYCPVLDHHGNPGLDRPVNVEDTLMGISHLKNKKILVVGLGKSGLSVSFFLHRQSIAFDVVDDRASAPGLHELQAQIPHVKRYQAFDATLFCSYDILVLSPGCHYLCRLFKPQLQAASRSWVI